ncbi:hypothetical protein IAT38_007452 [Cryptococcus sp. DSM 104549]
MAESSMSTRQLPPHLSRPHPGDGTFLSQDGPRPGDGAFLLQQARQNRSTGQNQRSFGEPRGEPNGRSNRERNGAQDKGKGREANGYGNGDGRQQQHGESFSRPRQAKPPSSPRSGGFSSDRPPRSPRGPGGFSSRRDNSPPRHRLVAAPPSDLEAQLNAVKVPQLQQIAPLDPDAPPFTPGAAMLASELDEKPKEDGQAGGRGRGEGSKKQPKKKKQAKGGRDGKEGQDGEKSAQQQPVLTGRRAAFEQSTKLTGSKDKKTMNAGEQGRGATDVKGEKPERKKPVESDDLVTRLTKGLKSRPFVECPICFNAITPSQPIWSCLPPDRPPEPSKSQTLDPNPITGSTAASNHYSACYTPFHLDCIRSWSDRSLQEEDERIRQGLKDGEECMWRCPGCQKKRSEPIGLYKCFCGRLAHPPTLTSAPHSCGDSCGRKRPKCSHPCPLPCHPGPCPPCQVALVVPCPSHRTSITVKCSVATSNNAALSPVCDEQCDRQLNCGNREHRCPELCHFGPCKPCELKETVTCYCGEEHKRVACGWGKMSEKICVKADEDGSEDVWHGRFDCGRPCDRTYDCGIHPCPETCHPHPIASLPCPYSPTAITHCPCGATPLKNLPNFPRPDCVAPVPTCRNRCPKNRPCGHPCPRTCHTGECPPCHEEVVKTCRCGQSQLLVGCDALRERQEKGLGEVTCERVCKALRNCGRHECGRMCCPLWEQAKTRNKKQRTDDHDLYPDDDLHKCHLTCGKTLGCGLHTCPKPDHKGPCGRCLQASYDELICNCGRTIVYPPVACGTTISCPFPCRRPAPACGHPKTPHQCHEAVECPPCPYLTDKPCACGKEPSVKNIRCSQERVSCGQPCGELLPCGYHRCLKSCHRPGECDPCNQVCGKPKRICKHPCTAACHAPAKCPETDPCQAIVTQTCACGNLQNRTSCGASLGNPKSRELDQLKCNSECAVKQRNARLADALGIKPGEKGQEVYEEELRSFAGGNHGFVKMVENTFEEFFKGPRQSMILPHMPPAKRTFVMALAEHYRLTRELIDLEPNRSVQIRRRIDTRIPKPLLSAAVQPAPVPQSRLVTNLGSAWNRSTGPGASGSTGSAGGTAASVVSRASSGSGMTRLGSAAASGSGPNSAVPSARPSRVSTPSVPAPLMANQLSRELNRENAGGGDGGDDWDVDL